MRVVALLRGVNLGPSRRLKMADLREVVESLGHTDVETYLQSGNVVFTAKGRSTTGLGPSLSTALSAAVGLEAGVLTRTGAQMAKIVAANPYPVSDPTKVVVSFLSEAGDASALRSLELDAYAPEGLTVHGTEVYFNLPDGQARSKLLEAVAKEVRRSRVDRATARNWRTVQALADMTA